MMARERQETPQLHAVTCMEEAFYWESLCSSKSLVPLKRALVVAGGRLGCRVVHNWLLLLHEVSNDNTLKQPTLVSYGFFFFSNTPENIQLRWKRLMIMIASRMMRMMTPSKMIMMRMSVILILSRKAGRKKARLLGENDKANINKANIFNKKNRSLSPLGTNINMFVTMFVRWHKDVLYERWAEGR